MISVKISVDLHHVIEMSSCSFFENSHYFDSLFIVELNIVQLLFYEQIMVMLDVIAVVVVVVVADLEFVRH